MNGSSAQSLVEPLTEAATALRAALAALEATCPNDRDYYVQGPDAGPEARREWRKRVEAVRAVAAEVSQIAETVQQQADERAARRKR